MTDPVDDVKGAPGGRLCHGDAAELRQGVAQGEGAHHDCKKHLERGATELLARSRMNEPRTGETNRVRVLNKPHIPAPLHSAAVH